MYRIAWFVWICLCLWTSLVLLQSTRSEEVNLSGKVLDTQGRPLTEAIVRVFASRPANARQTVVPIMHPHCQVTNCTDKSGQFVLSGIDATHEVILIASKPGYVLSRTKYLPSDSKDVSVVLQSFSESKLSSTLKGTLVDDSENPIAGAVVGYEDTYYGPEPDDYNHYQKALVTVTDQKGVFELPSEKDRYPDIFEAVVPKYGRREIRIGDVRDFNPVFARPFQIEPGLTVTGRIVGPQGPIDNYLVCVSPATTRGECILHVVATRADGTFLIEGIAPRDRDGNDARYCLFGDIAQNDARGHLETKRFDSGLPGQTLDFGDLNIQPVTDLEIRFLVDEGPIKVLETQVSLSFPQLCRSSNPVSIPSDGVVQMKNIPREAMHFDVRAGTNHEYTNDKNLQSLPDHRGFILRPGQQRSVEVKLKSRKSAP